MKAWLIDDLKSGIGQLRVGNVMDPVPEPGEAVVDVRYAALNPADRYLSEGQYPAKPSLPHILGRDAVGTVREVATDVQVVKPGDRVLLLRSEVGMNKPGTFAERFAVPVASLAAVPSGWDEEQAAGAPLVYLTAYQALTMWGELPRGGVVLVTGASGGVGVATVQLAQALGHTVVALSRSADKRQHLERLGAAHAIDPTAVTDPTAAADPKAADWRQTVKQLLGRRRVDLAVDNIGGGLFPQVLDVMAEHGRVSCVGQLAGAVPSFKTASLFFRRLKVGGVSVGAYTAAESQSAWRATLDLMAKTGAKPLVDRVFPFEQLPRAFDRLQVGPMGKVVLGVGAKG